MTYTVASSLVRTSPLAVITVVGLLDGLMVSSSAEFKSFCTAHMHTRSWINHKLSFLRHLCFRNPEDSFFRRVERTLVFFLVFVCFWQGSMPCIGHIAAVVQSLQRTCPQISQRRDFADEEFWHFFFSTMVLFFSRILAWRSVDFVNRTLWIEFQTFCIGFLRHSCVPWEASWDTQPICDSLFHNSHSILVIAFSSFREAALFRLSIWLFLVMRKQKLVSSHTTRFHFYRIGTRAHANYSQGVRVQVPFK